MRRSSIKVPVADDAALSPALSLTLSEFRRFISRIAAAFLVAMSVSEKKLLCRSVYRIVFRDDAALPLALSLSL
jgi:hypothetical protein